MARTDRLMNEARALVYQSPAARDFVQAADDYARLAYDLSHLQEIHRRVKLSIAIERSPSIRRLRQLREINGSLLITRKRDAAQAKAALAAATERYLAQRIAA